MAQDETLKPARPLRVAVLGIGGGLALLQHVVTALKDSKVEVLEGAEAAQAFKKARDIAISRASLVEGPSPFAKEPRKNPYQQEHRDNLRRHAALARSGSRLRR